MNWEFLVPPRARPVPPVERTRVMLLGAITIFALVSLSGAMVYATLFIDLAPYRALSFCIAAALFLGAPLVTRVSGSVDAGLCIALLAAMSAIVPPAYYQGGLNSVLLVWLVVIPMVATLYLRVSLGIFASLCGALIFAGFFWLEGRTELPPHVPEKENALVLFNLVLALLFITSMSLLASQALKRRESALRAAVRDAEESARALRERNEQLEHSQRMESIGRLAGGVAHDFNNLLMVITGYTEAAIDQAEGQAGLEESLNEILKAGDQAAVLTRQLLAFSRRQLLEPKTIQMNELIREFTGMVRRLLPENVRVENHLSHDLWSVFIDPHRIEQVLMNLAVNARDAMPTGGVLSIGTENRVFVGGDVSGLAPGEYVRVSVRDTGCGMDEETQARAFEPFFTTKAMGKGTGLGLSMAYGTVIQSGGGIEIDSGPEEGCEIGLLLPRAESAEDEAFESGDEHGDAVGTERILVVEDDSSVRRLVVDRLARSGFRVESASDGAIAAERLESDGECFDLLISDLVMPNLGGEELVRRCDQVLGDTPVIFLSGYSEHVVAVDTFGDRLVEVVQKPLRPRSLIHRVRMLLDLAAARSR